MSDETKAAVNDMGSRAINALMVWKLAVLELFIMCAIAAGTFFLGGTGDEDFSQLSPSARARFMVGMALSVLGVIKSFLSTTVSTLKKGGTLPPDIAGDGNGTQTWARQQTRTDVIQTTASPVDSSPKTP